jgi:O-antigen ligase
MKNFRASPVLISLLWGLSFLCSLPLIKPYEISRLCAIGFLLCAIMLAGNEYILRAERPALGRPIPVSLGLFFLLAAASLIWTPAFSVSFISLWTFFLLPGGFLLFLMAENPAVYKNAACFAGCLVGGLGLWALVQYFFLPGLLVNGQVRIPFANPNNYAALLALGFFPGLGFMLRTKKRLHANLALLYGAVTLGGIIIIGGRGVLLATFLMAAFFLLAVRPHLARHRRCGVVLALTAFAAFILPYLIRNDQVMALDRLQELTTGPEAATATRLSVWHSTWEMIKTHPLTGTGLGTFYLYYPQYRLPADQFSGGLMTHNDPLQFWAEIGILGPVLFYLVLAIAGFYMIRFLQRTPSASEDRIMPVAAFCGLGVIALHVHIDFDLYGPATLCLCGLVLAFWHQQTVSPLTSARRLSPVIPIIAALAALPILFPLQGLLRSEYYTNQAKAYALRGDMNAYGAMVNKAHDAGFGLNARAYAMAAIVPLGLLENPDAALPPSEKEALITQTESLLARAISHNPRNVLSYYEKARLRRISGDSAAAADILEKTLVMDPRHLPSRLLLADLYEKKGEREKAWTLLRAGLDYHYGFHNPLLLYKRLLDGGMERNDLPFVKQMSEKIEEIRIRNNTALKMKPRQAPDVPPGAPVE